MDLWILPIVGSAGETSPMNTHEEQDAFVNLREEFMEGASAARSFTTLSLAIPIFASTQGYKTERAAKEVLTNSPLIELRLFSHTARTKANSIKFAHQSMRSPKITTLLKAIRRCFLDGCPNLSARGVTRYLNPSPATAKGHMKRPHQGIRSTTTKQLRQPPSARPGTTVHATLIADDNSWMDDIYAPSFHAGPLEHGPLVIIKDDDSSVGNIFCFTAFAEQRTGVLYNDLTSCSHTCPWRAMYATSSYTTTNPMGFLVSQYPVLMTALFLRRMKHSSNFWKAKVS